MAEKLEACPHCSGSAIVVSTRAAGLTWWHVECDTDNCRAIGPERGGYAEAIAAWNTCPSSATIKALVEVVRKVGAEKTIDELLHGDEPPEWVNATPERRVEQALSAMTEHYVSLINSGDAGNWDPEEEDVVKQARAAQKEQS